jgi:hypothetical protein
MSQITVKHIMTSSLGRHIAEINGDCISYDINNVRKLKWTNQISSILQNNEKLP